MKYTSAEAGKLVKKLEDEIRDLLDMEARSALFNAAYGEDPELLRPEYDFKETEERLETLRAAVRKVKHAINVFNTTHELPGFPGVTVDQALVYIPQLTSRKEKLRAMAAHLPKERQGDAYRFGAKTFIDYELINYDRQDVKDAYERITKTLTGLQLALDTVNTTEKMEIVLP